MLTKLTGTKEKVYNLYKQFSDENRFINYKEASERLKIQVSAIFKHVNDLVKLGYLEKRSDGSVIAKNTSNNSTIPLLGTIACGSPLCIFEEFNSIEVPNNLLKGSGNFFALTADGDSMINAGILPGDYLVIKQQSDVNDGDIGVLIEKDDFDERATLKQIFHTSSGVLAKPQNPLYKNFIIANSNAEIRGKLVGVIRNM